MLSLKCREPSGLAKVRRNDVLSKSAKTLCVNDVKRASHLEGRRKDEGQDRRQCAASPRRHVMIGNARRVRFYERIREYVDIVGSLEARRQLRRIPSMPTVPMVVVNDVRDTEAASRRRQYRLRRQFAKRSQEDIPFIRPKSIDERSCSTAPSSLRCLIR